MVSSYTFLPLLVVTTGIAVYAAKSMSRTTKEHSALRTALREANYVNRRAEH